MEKRNQDIFTRGTGLPGGCTYSGKSAGYFETLDLAATGNRGAGAAFVCRSESALQHVQFNFKT